MFFWLVLEWLLLFKFLGVSQKTIQNHGAVSEETALEMAQDAGNDELVAQIEKDLKGAKLRLDIGRDLNQVKYLQDKYSKFMPTEGLAYESKLAILLNKRLK